MVFQSFVQLLGAVRVGRSNCFDLGSRLGHGLIQIRWQGYFPKALNTPLLQTNEERIGAIAQTVGGAEGALEEQSEWPCSEAHATAKVL